MAGRRIATGGSLVLDSEGLSKLSVGDGRARAFFETARARGGGVVVSAVTLAEVLRGAGRDALVHRVLSRVTIAPVTAEVGRHAGELLGRSRLSGHRCTVDSIVAATALVLPRPVVLLTSDPIDLSRLVDEPEVPKNQRIAVVHV